MIDLGISTDLVDILWRQTWQSMILVALVYPVAKLSQARYPHFTFVLWLMVAIKSLIPIQLRTPVVSGAPFVNNLQELVALPAIEVGTVANQAVQYHQLLIMIYLMVVGMMVARIVIGELRFKRKIQDQQIIEVGDTARLVKYFGIDKQLRIVVSPHVSSPLTIGFKSPLILLPEEMRNHPSILSVIAHELAHIKRRDILTITMQVILKTVFFFNPLIHLINQQLDLNRERICDEMAVAALKMDHRRYGHELLSYLEVIVRPQPDMIINGGLFLSKKNVLKRFEYLIKGKGHIMLKIKMGQKLILGVLVGIMVILSCSSTEGEQTSSTPTGSSGMVRRINPEDGSVSWVTPPPKAEDNPSVMYDTSPEPIGGYAAIQQAVVYPEVARKAGIQGTVIVQVLIDKSGKATEALVLRGIEDSSINEAAVSALLAISWKPAENQDEPVSVRITVPVVFKLKAE